MESFKEYRIKFKADGVFQYAWDVVEYLRIHNIHELKHVKKVWHNFFLQGNDLCVNRKWCLQLKNEPALQALLKAGIIEQYRNGFRRTVHTYLRLKQN